MLDEVCPEQFIDGINESEKPMKIYSIAVQPHEPLAIAYIPKRIYTLTKLEVYLLTDVTPDEREFSVVVYSDYNDNPSDIPLSRSQPVTKIESFPGWQEAQLSPFVIGLETKYWVAFDSGKGALNLALAKSENEVALKVPEGQVGWETYSLCPQGAIMLRFYGRVLPIAFSGELICSPT